MKTPVEALLGKSSRHKPDVAAFPPVVLDRIDLSAAEFLPPVSGGSGEIRPDAHIQTPSHTLAPVATPRVGRAQGSTGGNSGYR
jgi:hypothetical protein